jgi:hypothetical protein
MEYLELYKSDGDEDNSSANKQYSLKFYVKETVSTFYVVLATILGGYVNDNILQMVKRLLERLVQN